METEGDYEVLKRYMLEKFGTGETFNDINFHGNRISTKELEIKWNQKQLGFLAYVLLKYLSTENRITHSDAIDNLDFQVESPRHPFHHIYLDDTLEEKIDTYFKQAFNVDLILNRFAGTKVHAHVGKKPTLEAQEDRASTSYSAKIRGLPTLSTQGDGMRSFASIIIEMYTSKRSILFIDEPEAFLHPPQARLLGKIIGNSETDQQIFISTHSGDFIKGLLEGQNQNIKIVRITRTDVTNTPHVLDKEGIRIFWKDPMLRYSPIIDGLFHSNVIVCESEGDCRFYFAMIKCLI